MSEANTTEAVATLTQERLLKVPRIDFHKPTCAYLVIFMDNLKLNHGITKGIGIMAYMQEALGLTDREAFDLVWWYSWC